MVEVLEKENSVLYSELKEKGEKPVRKRREVGTHRCVIYSISDKGRRLIEISENLSEEEVKDFLKISQCQLEVLRTVLKEGPKRVRDFPYNPRYSLKRMIERGFLDKTVKSFDVEQLRRMRDKGFLNPEIAEKLGISLNTFTYWVRKLNLERRRKRLRWMDCRDSLHQLLKANGPMPKREAMETLGFHHRQTETILGMFPGEFQKLNFVAGRTKHSSKFYDLVKASPVLTLKGDPRIIDFVASHISLKVETGYDAKSVVHLLKWQMGHRQAREVVERLGYRYYKTP